MYFIYKTRKKTPEETYEGNIRSDFSSTKKYIYAICLEDFCLLVRQFKPNFTYWPKVGIP